MLLVQTDTLQQIGGDAHGVALADTMALEQCIGDVDQIGEDGEIPFQFGIVVTGNGRGDLARHVPGIHQPQPHLGVTDTQYLFLQRQQRHIRALLTGLVQALELGREQVAKQEQAEVVQQTSQIGHPR